MIHGRIDRVNHLNFDCRSRWEDRGRRLRGWWRRRRGPGCGPCRVWRRGWSSHSSSGGLERLLRRSAGLPLLLAPGGISAFSLFRQTSTASSFGLSAFSRTVPSGRRRRSGHFLWDRSYGWRYLRCLFRRLHHHLIVHFCDAGRGRRQLVRLVSRAVIWHGSRERDDAIFYRDLQARVPRLRVREHLRLDVGCQLRVIVFFRATSGQRERHHRNQHNAPRLAHSYPPSMILQPAKLIPAPGQCIAPRRRIRHQAFSMRRPRVRLP